MEAAGGRLGSQKSKNIENIEGRGDIMGNERTRKNIFIFSFFSILMTAFTLIQFIRLEGFWSGFFFMAFLAFFMLFLATVVVIKYKGSDKVMGKERTRKTKFIHLSINILMMSLTLFWFTDSEGFSAGFYFTVFLIALIFLPITVLEIKTGKTYTIPKLIQR